MKKIIGLVTLFFGLAANAQSTTTGDVTLNVKLQPIQTLIVNKGLENVDLIYATKDDYKNGVTAPKADQLSIYSTGGFEIKVKTNGDLKTNGSPLTINANSITVTPKAGTAAISNATYTAANLTTGEQTIVAATTGGVDKNVSIDYKGAGSDAYLNNYIKGNNPTVYTATVTYTIYAK